MNKAKLTSLLLILCMAGSGVAAEASSFTAYAAEEETVITEDVNEEEEAVEEAPADEPEDEAAVEEPAEEPEEPVAEEPAEEPAAENVEEPADEAVTEDTEDVSVEAEELPVEEKEAEEVQEAQTDEFLIDASTPDHSWVENHSMYYIDSVKGYAKGFKTIDGVKYHFNEETCYLDVGFFTYNGFVYYGSESGTIGKLASGFTRINGRRYYFWPETKDGHYIHTRAKGWFTLNGFKYYGFVTFQPVACIVQSETVLTNSCKHDIFVAF